MSRGRPADPIWAEQPWGLLPVRWIASRLGRPLASVHYAAKAAGAAPGGRASRGPSLAPERIWRRLLDAWGLEHALAWVGRYGRQEDAEQLRLVAAGQPLPSSNPPRAKRRTAPRACACPKPLPMPEPPPEPLPVPPPMPDRVETLDEYLARGGRIRRIVLTPSSVRSAYV